MLYGLLRAGNIMWASCPPAFSSTAFHLVYGYHLYKKNNNYWTIRLHNKMCRFMMLLNNILCVQKIMVIVWMNTRKVYTTVAEVIMTE